MLRIDAQALAHTLLYGPESGWGARFGCGPRTITALAIVAVLLHGLDLASGIRMMLVYGIDQEQNPLARTLFQAGGPQSLAIAKLGVVMAGVLLLLWLARAGRARLSRNSLLVIGMLGLLGSSSNFV